MRRRRTHKDEERPKRATELHVVFSSLRSCGFKDGRDTSEADDSPGSFPEYPPQSRVRNAKLRPSVASSSLSASVQKNPSPVRG